MLHRPPPHPQGYMMQKLIARHPVDLPCYCTDLCTDGACLARITGVTACAPASVTPCGAGMAEIIIPVSVSGCGAQGAACAVSATVRVQAALPPFLLCPPEPCTVLMALPCVRLLHAEPSCGGCFRATLCIRLEICLLRYEVCPCPPPHPVCPQLPLYPPPIR